MTDHRTDSIDADQLMRELKEGDLDRAADLFDLYHQRLYNFFLKSTYHREASLDMTQTVFYRMISYRRSYREGHPFRSWIYQIARNILSDYYRKEKVAATFVDIESIAEQAESSSEQEDSYRQLYRALAMLEHDQRELLVMSKFQKMKYKEIAAIMNTTVGNVKVRVHRALQELKEQYNQIEAL